MDWNGDGKKDLIAGDSSGYVSIFLNKGSDANPSLDAPFNVLEQGWNFSVNLRSTPEVVDWNNDGKKDLLCGEDSGYIYLLTNMGTDSSPLFGTKQYLTYTPVSTVTKIKMTRTSCPVVVDWDRDGKKDLLTGTVTGYVFFYRNSGTDSAPFFTKGVLVKVGGTTIDIGDYSRIEVCDWDNNQQWDLLVGDFNGQVHLYLSEDPPAQAQGVWTLYGENLLD